MDKFPRFADFASYLRGETPVQGQQEFRLVVHHHVCGTPTMMIHPINRDGDTGDFIIYDDTVREYQWGASTPPNHDGIDMTEVDPSGEAWGYAKQQGGDDA